MIQRHAHGKGLQSRISLEDVPPQRADGIRNRHAYEAGAVREGPEADGGHAFRDIHCGQAGAVREGFFADAGYGGIDIHNFQGAQAFEGILADFAVLHVYGSQVVASRESPRNINVAAVETNGQCFDGRTRESAATNGRNGSGQGNAGHVAVTVVGRKGLGADGFSAKADGHRLHGAVGADLHNARGQRLDRARNFQGLQGFTAVDETVAQCCNGFRQDQGVQADAAGEGVAAHFGHTAAQGNGRQVGTAGEGAVADIPVDRDAVDGPAAPEGVAADFCNPRIKREQNTLKYGTAIGKMIRDLRYLGGFRQVNGLQVRAVHEGAGADAGYGSRQRDEMQVILAFEGVFSNGNNVSSIDYTRNLHPFRVSRVLEADNGDIASALFW